MINLPRCHHCSQKDKNHEREDTEFTVFMFFFFFDVANIICGVKTYCNVVFFARVRLCSSVNLFLSSSDG